MQISLFGGVRATTNDGDEIDVGPSKCQAVLATLALSAGAAVPVPRIVEQVWGDAAPRTAEKTLQSYVTRLRKGLGADRIERTGNAYCLMVDPVAVDVLRFQRELNAGEPGRALEEWTGAPLAGVAAAGLVAQVDSLQEQWLAATESDLERQVDANPAVAVSSLTELTAAHPFREGFWALYMTALYRLDRQADALAAYRSARNHLVEELGVEPGVRLRELEAAILGQSSELDRSAESLADLPTGVVTFAFCEIVDGARLWSDRSSESADLVRRHASAVQDSAAVHRGHVFAKSGDATGVAFHRATDAVGWAQDIETESPLPTRIGVHTGEAEERGDDYFGPSVNVASRLAAVAHPNQVLLTNVTAALAGSLDVLDLGTLQMDNVVVAPHVFQLGRKIHPQLGQSSQTSGNLPRRLGPLIGRRHAVEVVTKRLDASPIVTLVGPGGIGKTRLAIEVARGGETHGATESLLVELASAASADDVVRAVAEVLDVQVTPTRPILDLVASTIADRAVLLVLDNCEHVIVGAAELSLAIVQRCANVRILATSREGLGLPEEHLIPVVPLEADDGVELFNARAEAASPGFDARAERHAVTEICARLDGVPLAIELAAARTRTLSPNEMLSRVDDHLRLLTGGRRSSVERHRTLRATIDWSYELLTEDEQELFRQLSIFTGGFDLAAVEQVAQIGAEQVDHLLDALVGQSMVGVESGPFGRRFQMLETMRQFGAEQLLVRSETESVASRHASWCVERVHTLSELLVGRHEVEGVARLAEFVPNLRAAVDWACVVGDYKLVHSLIRPIASEIGVRAMMEVGDWVERLLEITPADDLDHIALALSWAAHRHMLTRDVAGYDALTERYGEPDHPLTLHARAFVVDDDAALTVHAPAAIEWLRDNGDVHFASLYEVSSVMGPYLATGQFDKHDSFATSRAAHYEEHGPPTFLNWTLFCLGYSAMFQGRIEDSDAYFERSAQVDVPERTISVNKPIEARRAMRKGNRAKALRLLHEYVQEVLESDNIMTARLATGEFCSMMVHIDELEHAATLMGHLEQIGEWGQLTLRTMLADTVVLVEADPQLSQLRSEGSKMEDRDALVYIRDALAAML